MREFQEKKRFKKYLYSKTAVAVLVFLILLMIRATWGVYKKEQASGANAIEATRELQRLEDRQVLLNSEIDRLSTDAGVEEEIRAKFGVSKPGEHMVVVVDTSQPTTTQKDLPQGWWSKVRNFFK